MMGTEAPAGAVRPPVRVAVIGVGYWGPNFVRTLEELPDAELVAVCDADRDRLARMAEKFPGPKYVTAADKIWHDPAVEAVVIATNSSTHFRLGMEALAAGKHVLVEKPLAMSVAEGRTMAREARRRGRVLLVGHLLRYHAGVVLLRETIERGELGEILYLYSTRVNLGKIRADESALWSLAPHDISVVLYLLGSFPREVSCWGESYVSRGVHDVVFVHLAFSGKVRAHIHASWLDPHKIRQFTVVGKKKMAVLDDTALSEKVRIYDKGVNFAPAYADYAESLTVRVGDIHIPRLNMVEPLKVECQHLLQCVRGEAKPETDGDSAVDVLRVIEAAERSLARGGRAVRLAERRPAAGRHARG